VQPTELLAPEDSVEASGWLAVLIALAVLWVVGVLENRLSRHYRPAAR
jgi:hypothetical protein